MREHRIMFPLKTSVTDFKVGKGRGVLRLHTANKFINLQAGHQCQGQLGTNTIEPDQLTKKVALALAYETIEQLGVFANHKMGMQGFDVVAANQGALAKSLSEIEKVMGLFQR
mgnify:CR=1 FL=1